MTKKSPGPQVIVSTSGADGACSAALVLMKYPGSPVLITSQRAVAWTLKGVAHMDPRPERVHVCGVGIADGADDVVEALQELNALDIHVVWYCGRGYLKKVEADLKPLCKTVFRDLPSNADAVAGHLRIPAGERQDLLLVLARQYVRRAKRISAEHRFWQDLLDATAIKYFQFGEHEPYVRTIHKLAGFLPCSKADKEEVALFQKMGPRQASLGSSRPMRRLRGQIKLIAGYDEPVLILGPSGSGKELVARALHSGSPRRSAPFVPVNCATVSTNTDLAYDRLFGHVSGAFTDATRAVPGAFTASNGGTLFLDEVAELPLPVQSQLLRVIEEKTIIPMGAMEPRAVDVRVIAATNQNLPALVSTGAFRLDLYYRINVLTLEVPPLKDRIRDTRSIADSVSYEIRALGRDFKLTKTDWQAIYAYDWPGNIRQFRNVLKRAALMKHPISEVLTQEARLNVHPGALQITQKDAQAFDLFCPRTLEAVRPEHEVRRRYMQHVVELFEGNLAQACRALGVSNNTLRRWVKAE